MHNLFCMLDYSILYANNNMVHMDFMVQFSMDNANTIVGLSNDEVWRIHGFQKKTLKIWNVKKILVSLLITLNNNIMGENRNHRNRNDKRHNQKSKPTEQELRDRLTKDINKLVSENEKLSEQKDNILHLTNFTQQATQFHLTSVKQATGSIEQEDVDYCIKLSKRVIDQYLKTNQLWQMN